MNDFSAPPSVALSTAVTPSVVMPVTIVTATRPKILSKATHIMELRCTLVLINTVIGFSEI